jgi:hypothetical protein
MWVKRIFDLGVALAEQVHAARIENPRFLVVN